jgi:hypothetical protein
VAERPDPSTADDGGRYHVDARCLPFTPSWFWEIIDTAENAVVENSLALSRAVYPSAVEALAAGVDYLARAVTHAAVELTRS